MEHAPEPAASRQAPRGGQEDLGVAGRLLESSALRAHLSTTLPDYMLPQHYVPLAAVPLLPNGKVDRAALPTLTALPAESSARARYVAPRNETEQVLVALWAELLDIGQVGVEDNFFEIGGHSLLALQMFARIEQHFGVNLPLSTLLRHQTCAALAALLPAPGQAPVTAAALPVEDWRPLVALRRGGSRPPLFCVHAVGGNVLNYRLLAAAMPADQPVYGLQAIGLDGHTRPLESIEAIAARYCEEVRQVQPHGPYFLCGGSLGGVLAFEMACQFEQAGEAVGLVGLLDTGGPGLRRAAAEAQQQAQGLGRRALEATRAGRWGELGGALRRRMLVAEDAAVVRWHRLQGSAVPHEVRWRLVEAANRRAYASHVEKPFGGPVALFRAVDEAEHLHADRLLGWGEVIRGPVEVVELPGTHEAFIEQPALAQALREVLARAQRAAGVLQGE